MSGINRAPRLGPKLKTVAEYFHDDGKPIQVKVGLHGLGTGYIEDKLMLIARSFGDRGEGELVDPLFIPPESFEPTELGLAASRQNRDSQDRSSLDNPPIVEFISFGRSHRYFAEDYPRYAPYWRKQLMTEARVLGHAIQGYQAIAYEFLEGDGSFAGWVTQLARSAVDQASDEKPVKPGDFDQLDRRVWATSDKVHAASAADYAVLHAAGIEFIRISSHNEYLRTRVQKRIECLIDTASGIQKGLEEVESQSFAILDLYGQVRFVGKPAALAAYRCGLILMRAGARYAGERLVETSTRRALKQAGVIIRKELPKAIADLLLSYIRKGFDNPLQPDAAEKLAEELIRIEIWLFFFTVDFYVFAVEDLPPSERANANEKFLDALAPELAKEVINSIISVGLVRAVGGLPEDSAKRFWLEKIGIALPVFINSVLDEIHAMKALAEREKRPFYEIFCSELGWAIVRVLKNVVTALAHASLKGWMERKQEADQEFSQAQYWRALILRLKLELTPADPSKVSARGEPAAIVQGQSAGAKPETPEPAPQGAPAAKAPAEPPAEMAPGKPVRAPSKKGPDAEGKVGVSKYRPVAGKAKPYETKKPGKLSKTERKKVKPAQLPKPPKNKSPKSKSPKKKSSQTRQNRKGKEFSDEEKEEAYQMNWREVQRKWPNDFKDKEHYLCENCAFVHSDKSLFNVDHVWDIQYGGSKDPYTKSQLQDMEKRDTVPQLLYERGWQRAVLCKGCNLGKNTKFDNAPGFIPKGKGYAHTRHDDDLNPDHRYQGPPPIHD